MTTRALWERIGGTDGAIRFGGALAVVTTVEAICGYYLWSGAVEHVGLPVALGWAPQFGLVGGSAVGTRSWHRGRGGEAPWGRAASLVAVAFTVVDAAGAALLMDGTLRAPRGWLALVLIVQCVVIGYLTVHTLFAHAQAPGRSRTSRHAPARQERRPEPRQEPASAPLPERQEPQHAGIHAVPDPVEEPVREPTKQERAAAIWKVSARAGEELTPAELNRRVEANGLIKGKHVEQWRTELAEEQVASG